ncbi:TonB-dependent receptor plug domain-containing protein [Aliikangiella sp. IMCC44653]
MKTIILPALSLFFSSLQALPHDSSLYSVESIESLTLEELLKVKITGASFTSLNLQQTPASVMVFDRRALDRMQIRDLSDLMKRIPSVDIVDNNHWYGELYTIRGIKGNDRFLVLLNGQQLNSQTGLHLSVGNSISLDMADSVEIIYGGASVIYGSDAFSSVINIKTTQKIARDKTELAIAGGSFNTRDLRLDSQFSWADDKWLRFYARSFYSDGLEFKGTGYSNAIARYQPPLKQEFEQPIDDYNLLLEWRNANLSGGYYRQAFNEGNGRGLGRGESPFLTILNKENQWRFNNDLLWFQWQSKHDNADLDIKATLQRFSLDSEAKFLEFSDETYTQITPFYKTGLDESAKLKATYRFPVFNDSNILIGMELDKIRSIPPYANDIVFGSPEIPLNSSTLSMLKTTRIWESKYAVFSELNLELNTKLFLLLSARYEYSKRYDNSFNPRVALNYELNSKNTFKLIYSTAFQAPSLNYINEQWGNEFFIMVPNTSQDFVLKNQRVQNSELIWQHMLNKSILLSTSIYQSNSKNLINYVFQESIYNRFADDFTIGTRFENIGRNLSRGIELSLQTQQERLNYYFNYAYTHAVAKTDSGETNVPLVSPHKISLGASYQWDDFSLSLDTRWISEPETLPSLQLTPTQQRSTTYASTDLAFRSELIFSNWRWNLRLNNIFNQKINHIGTSDSSTLLIPQPGRNYLAGIEYQF